MFIILVKLANKRWNCVYEVEKHDTLVYKSVRLGEIFIFGSSENEVDPTEKYLSQNNRQKYVLYLYHMYLNYQS